ncbi:hypothetical protein FQA39_LY07887 [Lamprigera yunnana]|nr:hypothetical protein FQA39_LY07887 [Lamprigera yunnana]
MPRFLDLLDFLHSRHFSYYEEKYDHHIQKVIKFSVIVAKLFFCSGMTTVMSILSAPIITSQDHRTTPLPFPVNLQNRSIFIYLAVYVFQIVALTSAAWTSIGFDNLSTSMMGLCSAYFAILRETIEETTKDLLSTKDDGNDLDKYRTLDGPIHKELSECAEHHLAVIKVTEEIENVFSYVFLSQFLCSAFGICFVGFTFINAEPGSVEFIFALSFLGTLMFQITLYCSHGNEVTLQSAMISDACYMTKWVYCGPLVRKTLFLIMERSKRPMVLTAGKFVNLSLESLMAVVRHHNLNVVVIYNVENFDEDEEDKEEEDLTVPTLT